MDIELQEYIRAVSLCMSPPYTLYCHLTATWTWDSRIENKSSLRPSRLWSNSCTTAIVLNELRWGWNTAHPFLCVNVLCKYKTAQKPGWNAVFQQVSFGTMCLRKFKQLENKKNRIQTAWKDKAKLIKMLLVSQDKYFTSQSSATAMHTLHTAHRFYSSPGTFFFFPLTLRTAYE